MSYQNFQSTLNFRKVALPFFLAVFAVFMVNNFSFADPSGSAGPDAITRVLCNVVTILQGTMGKAIATIGICVLGIGLFLGKINWAIGIATAIGIGLIFGASSFIAWVASGTGSIGTVQDCGSINNP